MVKRGVPFRIGFFKRLGAERKALPTFNSDLLDGHADIGIAVANKLTMAGHPIRRGIEAAADVQPLNQNSAIEFCRVCRTHHHNPRSERRRTLCFGSPTTVGAKLADMPV